MTVLINKKICDNAKECNGITVCPVKAITWDDQNKTIVIDDKKCIDCGLCEKSCLVGAMKVARTSEEYDKIKAEIDNDPRIVSDLFVDRYGATPVGDIFLFEQSQFAVCAEESTNLTYIELFKGETIECLVNSIPIKELCEKKYAKYRKIEVVDDSLLSKYKISKLPCLLIFDKGKFLGKVEGYYPSEKKSELLKIIDNIINQSGSHE